MTVPPDTTENPLQVCDPAALLRCAALRCCAHALVCSLLQVNVFMVPYTCDSCAEGGAAPGVCALPQGVSPGWFTRMLKGCRTANKVRAVLHSHCVRGCAASKHPSFLFLQRWQLRCLCGRQEYKDRPKLIAEFIRKHARECPQAHTSWRALRDVPQADAVQTISVNFNNDTCHQRYKTTRRLALAATTRLAEEVRCAPFCKLTATHPHQTHKHARPHPCRPSRS